MEKIIGGVKIIEKEKLKGGDVVDLKSLRGQIDTLSEPLVIMKILEILSAGALLDEKPLTETLLRDLDALDYQALDNYCNERVTWAQGYISGASAAKAKKK